MQKRVRFVLIGIAAALLVAARAGAQGCGGMGRGTLLAQPSASASPDAKGKTKRMVARLWHGRTLTDSGNPGYINGDWFFDARWGPMMGYQPRDGELVGIFVASGNLRDGNNLTRATCPGFCERSNVALIPWSTGGGVSYVFNAGKTLLKP